jgi:hypothetical protein
MLYCFNLTFEVRYQQNISCEFANSLYTVSYTIARVSLKILVWANNNVQRYINLSTPVDEKFDEVSTV